MKKLICILASAALFGACEQKTDVAPTAALVPEKKTDKAVDPNTVNRSKKPTLTSAANTETTTETTTTATSSPTP